MLTHQRRLRLSLPVEVIKELGVAGKHAATGGAGHQSLLSVAAEVLSEAILDLEECVTAFPMAE